VRWGAGDRLAIHLEDAATGQPYIACEFACTGGTGCSLTFTSTSTVASAIVGQAPAVPRLDLLLHVTYNASTGTSAVLCALLPLVAFAPAFTVPPAAVTPSFVSSPNVHLRYVEVVQ
jgi:hypothetical protein